MKLSIVLTVLDSHEVVRRQLLHFAKIGLPDDTELILVDDGSDPPLRLENLRCYDTVSEHGNIPTWIHRTHDTRPWTWALARNAGAHLATGRYLVMYDIDHILTKEALDFLRGFDGMKVQFIREFGVLDENGELQQDRDTLTDYGLRHDLPLRIGPHPNMFCMRKDLFWELGGYREDVVEKPYPQGEDRSFRSKWRTFDPTGAKVCTHRPKIFVFPNGKYCGDVDADPKGLFHTLSRKTKRNFWYQKQRSEDVKS